MKPYLLLIAMFLCSTATMANPDSEYEITTTISDKKQIDKESVLLTERYLNGQIARQGMYYKNEMQGLWQKFDENGRLICEFNYEKGKRQGTGRIYENGKLKYELVYHKGERIDILEF